MDAKDFASIMDKSTPNFPTVLEKLKHIYCIWSIRPVPPTHLRKEFNSAVITNESSTDINGKMSQLSSTNTINGRGGSKYMSTPMRHEKS